jgi:Na+/H+ antiporter NhaD/arsenite permease-like protein
VTESGAAMGAMILPVALFVLTYAAIMTERINRAVAALLGGGVAIAAGLLSQEEAIEAVDFNTLALLSGMMIVVGVSKKSGLFGYVAIKSVQIARGSPAGILFALSVITAVFSALLDNVTTVLLIVPVTLVICSELHVRPYPFLFAEIFASNIGGTATLIGDPPNILIGSAVGLSFNDFVYALTPVVVVIFAVQSVIMHLSWGRNITASQEHRARVMANDAAAMIEDPQLLRYSLAVLALVLIAFVMARSLNLEAGTIALLGGAVLMLLDTLRRPREHHAEAVTSAFHEVEWITIFFFVGLFIVVGSLEKAGVLEYLSKQLLALTGGDVRLTAIYVLWGAAILSAIVDNIPFVATMIPLISGIAPELGGEEAILPVWWALALGACLGGNGTLIGASANLTVAGIAEKSGAPIRFLPFMLAAFPQMLLSIAICHVYLVWRFF